MSQSNNNDKQLTNKEGRLTKKFQDLTVSDFPGVDPQKFDDWKTAQLSVTQAVNSGYWFLWSPLTLRFLMNGLLTSIIFMAAFVGWVLYMVLHVKPLAERARELQMLAGIPNGQAFKASPLIELLLPNEHPYNQPEKPLGFALGWFFIFTNIIYGLSCLAVFYQGTLGSGEYQMFYGVPGDVPGSRTGGVSYGVNTFYGVPGGHFVGPEDIFMGIAGTLQNLLLGVLCLVSVNGLMIKKPYGYQLTQALLIIEIIWFILHLHLDFIGAGFFISINLAWICYFQKRKYMFVSKSGNRQHI